MAVAALRFSVPDDVMTATLTLEEADGSVVTPATALQACPTSADWAAANPGPSADAPEPDCTSPVALTRDSDSLRWTGDVGSLFATGGGERSLMILPADPPDGGPPVDPGFRVSFSGASLATTTPPATTPTTAFAGSPPSSASPSPAVGAGSTASSSSDSLPDVSSYTPSGDSSLSPATTAVSTTPTTAPAEVAAPAVDTGAFQPPTLAEGAVAGGGGGADQPWGRLVVLVPLSAAIGVASTFGRRFLARRVAAA